MEANREWYKEQLLNRIVENLKSRDFDAFWFRSKEDARDKILNLIPKDARVGVGGSISIRELKVIEDLVARGNIVIHHWKAELDPEADFYTRREELLTDVFLVSSNAITMDGILVNTDGVGNRVAGMIFGPKMVIVVVGINKIVKDIEEALWRIKNVAAPINAHRLGLNTPCAKTGYCSNCTGINNICRVTTIIERKPSKTNFTVLLVSEELGY
ncbi:MAG: lactate utilization protein [bacterium]